MRWFTFLISLFSFSLLASPEWINKSSIDEWEKIALQEIDKYKKENPEKEFLLYLTAARELRAYGLNEKSKNYYQKAYDHPSKGDKSEAVIELVSLNKDSNLELKKSLVIARQWFKNNPRKLSRQIDKWLEMMEGYSIGKTPYQEQGYQGIWGFESRVTELMKEGKSQEAFALLGPRDLKNADINQKVRQDLLAALSLGRKSPPLWCESTLEKYPNSYTWTMRLCRYLHDWKKEKKSKETLQTIREQLKKESPERVYWSDLLEKL
ncbi:MAG: hypothetical protein K2P81_09070 [Bacteriovoracaceae bacterium]|nr:hypothetical protein [Bacteriovoracaceae bacterium]